MSHVYKMHLYCICIYIIYILQVHLQYACIYSNGASTDRIVSIDTSRTTSEIQMHLQINSIDTMHLQNASILQMHLQSRILKMHLQYRHIFRHFTNVVQMYLQARYIYRSHCIYKYIVGTASVVPPRRENPLYRLTLHRWLLLNRAPPPPPIQLLLTL